MHIEDTQRLVAEIEMLKVVLYLEMARKQEKQMKNQINRIVGQLVSCYFLFTRNRQQQSPQPTQLQAQQQQQQQQQLVTEAQIATLTASVDYLSHRIEQLAASVEALRQELKDDNNNNNFIFIITTSYPLRFYAGSSQSILALFSWCIVQCR